MTSFTSVSETERGGRFSSGSCGRETFVVLHIDCDNSTMQNEVICFHFFGSLSVLQWKNSSEGKSES